MHHRGGSMPIWPDAAGRFGPYGGQYVPETLVPALAQLDEAYEAARADPE
ncbi:MAG: tryptophan synthase subunit beta, partial [Phycisphaerae bacterium]